MASTAQHADHTERRDSIALSLPGRQAGINQGKIMRWGGGRESENVEDRRSDGGGGMGRGISGGGIGVIVIAVAAMFLGVDPSLVMSVLEGTFKARSL